MAPLCFRLKSSESGRKKREEVERSDNLLENGGMLLQEMIASCDGKCKQAIRTFSVKDLLEATNNFAPDRILGDGENWKLYRGMVGNRQICVKKFTRWYEVIRTFSAKRAITDIVIGSQMSAHKCVLKLIGCCLESQYPMLVYDFSGDNYFTLENYIFASSENKGLQPLPWKSRIKIAMNIANAVAYLHTAFVRPVVLLDIQPKNIVIDNNLIPKLLDFSLSVTIPEGETHVETHVTGTIGFMDPTYVLTGLVNEKSDVYGFGVILLMLLTGKNVYELYNTTLAGYMKIGGYKESLDPSIVAEGSSWLGKEEQLYKFHELALKCVSYEREDRPTMTDVGKELTHMYRSFPQTALPSSSSS